MIITELTSNTCDELPEYRMSAVTFYFCCKVFVTYIALNYQKEDKFDKFPLIYFN